MYKYSEPRLWNSIEEIMANGSLLDNFEKSFLSDENSQSFRLKVLEKLEQDTGAILFRSDKLKSLNLGISRDKFNSFCHFIGTPVPIDTNGTIFKDIEDKGYADTAEQPVRGHMTSENLPFHSDRSDITALFCFSPSESGGESKVISSRYVVKALRENFPELVYLINEKIPHDLRNENPDMDYCYIPMLHESQDNFVFRYIRRFFDSVSRFNIDIKKEWVKLYDAIDLILNNEENHVSCMLKKGDLLLLNNHTVLHSREKFTDRDLKRKLFRCWLTHEFTRDLPDSYKPIFHSTKGGSIRGGVRLL